MTDPLAIAIVGAAATVITSTLSLLASLRNHKSLRRVESATNGLMADRDQSTATIAHAAGKAEQKAEDAASKASS